MGDIKERMGGKEPEYITYMNQIAKELTKLIKKLKGET